MFLHMFAIFDRKAEAFLPPFFLPAEGMALRTFEDCVNDSGHAFGAHPEDYTLFKLGMFDDANASIEMLSTPISRGIGVSFLKPVSADDLQAHLPLVNGDDEHA